MVLVEGVDSDADEIRRLLRHTTEGDFRVRRFTDLASTRTVLADECPDCVLLDLDLPDSEGVRTLSHVLSLTSSPVVVLTGAPAALTGSHALSNSSVGFLAKSNLTAKRLSSAITNAIDQQDRLIELRAHAHRPNVTPLAQSTALRDASLDPLTGALNAQALVAAIDHELHNPWHALETLGVLHCSITRDDGQPIDPATLQMLRVRLASAVRVTDHVARTRGTNFVIVAPHLPDHDALDVLADRVRTSFGRPCSTSRGSGSFTVSIGHGAVTIGHACVIAPPLPQLLLTSAELAQAESSTRAAAS